MLPFDHDLFLTLNASPAAPSAVVQLARMASGALPWAAVAALAWLARGRAGRRAALLCLASLALAWVMAWAIRAALPSPRPGQLGLGMQWVAHALNSGFPSMHASAAFALAMCLAWCAPRGLALAGWALALLVAWSRVCLGVHFPSDVLAGAATGSLAACMAVGLARRWPAPAAALSAPGRS